MSAQTRLDKADAFKQIGPVGRGDLAHRGDDVAQGDIRRTQSFLGLPHDGIDRCTLGGQTFLEPSEHGVGSGIAVAQPLGELGCKLLGQWACRAAFNILHQRRVGLPGHRKKVCKPVGIEAQGASLCDLIRQPAKILDQNDSERDGDRPKLADRKRLDSLIGDQEPAKDFRVEMAVGMGDEGPSYAKHTRVACERPAFELWQQPVIPVGQIGADFTDLCLDQMVVVQQPLGSGNLLAPLGNLARARTIGGKQSLGVFIQAPPERRHPERFGGDALRGGQGNGMLFQPLGTQKLRAHR